MSVLSTISKPDSRPVVVTICGDSGMGKTSLAATFPKPVFIRAEDGMLSIPEKRRPDAFPVISKVSDLWDQLIALLKEEHDYQTVVIDSITALERLFVKDVLDSDGKAKSINQALGGYGAGWASVAANHERVRKATGLLNTNRRMNVVFTAHADVETIRPPDMDDFTRYTLRLNSKSLPPYVDDVDIVGFIRLATVTKGDDGERKRAISTGQRELICHATASNVSKNRFGITQALPMEEGVNPLEDFVPVLKGQETVKRQPKTKRTDTETREMENAQ